MCNTFNPNCPYNKSNIKRIVNVYCPNTMCSGVLCVHKKIFHSPKRGIYQCPKSKCTCQVRKFLLNNKQFFPLKCDQGIYFMKTGKNQFKTLMELSIVQHVQTKFVFNCQPTKTLISTTVEKAKLAFSCFKFHLRNKNLHYLCLVEMVHIVSPERRIATLAKKNHLHFWWVSYANNNAAHRNLCHKRKNSFHFWRKLVDSTLVDKVNRSFICILIVCTFSLEWSHMIFSVSNNGIEWSLDFRPNSVTLKVKDVVHEDTISS